MRYICQIYSPVKNLKTYSQLFENVGELTPEQVKWLNKCTEGTWKINPQTGLVDVNGIFDCSEQDLTDFKGVRFGVVGWRFLCTNNQLTSLEGAPQEVGGWFNCADNQLTSLEGAPQRVGGGFNCADNQLTTLEGAPQEVGGLFSCADNPVSKETLGSIFSLMKKGESYLQAVESLWSDIPLEDRVLLYRPEFEWVSPEERRKLEAMRAYYGIKGMI
jgi:hypothetical protein